MSPRRSVRPETYHVETDCAASTGRARFRGYHLAKIPADRRIVVYCYTGHTGGLATMALCMMGYDAVNMKFGIMSWTRDAEVRASTPFIDEVDAHDYSVEPPQ